MSEPYYKQEYQGERKLDGEAPVFSFDQIMKETFLRPFTWNARTTRRSFWIGIVITEVIIWIGGIITFLATVLPVSHYENDSVDMINGFAFNSNHISAIVIIGMIILGLVTGTVTSMIVALIFVFLGIAMFVVHLIRCYCSIIGAIDHNPSADTVLLDKK